MIVEKEKKGKGGSGAAEIADVVNFRRAVLGFALQALRRNKLRSFLTLLGVIIGVMTVVAVVSSSAA